MHPPRRTAIRSAMVRMVENRCEMTMAVRSTQGAHAFEELCLGLGIDGGGGLVEDEHLGLHAHEGARHGQLLPLAGGEFVARLEPAAQDRVVALAQALDQGGGAAASSMRSRSARRSGLPTPMFSAAVNW
jgi:hypothetical protein